MFQQSFLELILFLRSLLKNVTKSLILSRSQNSYTLLKSYVKLCNTTVTQSLIKKHIICLYHTESPKNHQKTAICVRFQVVCQKNNKHDFEFIKGCFVVIGRYEANLSKLFKQSHFQFSTDKTAICF